MSFWNCYKFRKRIRKQFIPAHEVQLVNYLVATRKPVGLILNFGEEKVEVKRKVKNLDRIVRQDDRIKQDKLIREDFSELIL